LKRSSGSGSIFSTVATTTSGSGKRFQLTAWRQLERNSTAVAL